MKIVIIALTPLAFGTLFLTVFSSGDETLPTATCVTVTAHIERVLATIRTLESGGDYTARARGATASGAYQFLDSTWDGYGGYRHASDAPPAVQDAKASALVSDILQQHDDDVSTIPVIWYIGHLPDAGSVEWDRVPAPEAGNRLTPREYQTRWMAEYERQQAPAPSTTSTTAVDEVVAPGGCSGVGIDASVLSAPHHDYPAWDWIIPMNTPIYAVRGGRVVSIKSWPHNWWTSGCGTNGGEACSTCGVGVIIEDEQGVRWTYCHGTNVTVALDATIEAGNQIMWSGNTGRSGTPHLHFEIRVDGEQRCPQSLLSRLYTSAAPGEPVSLTSTGCWF